MSRPAKADCSMFAFRAYNGSVPHRIFAVSFTDCKGLKHTVEVSADSLYEAAALALDELRWCGFTSVIPGPTARLEIAIKEPGTTHEVPLRKLRDWVESSAKSPRDRVIKERLKTLLES
jgi:hypothetical protein